MAFKRAFERADMVAAPRKWEHALGMNLPGGVVFNEAPSTTSYTSVNTVRT